MDNEVTASNWSSIIRPMRYANAPAVDARYWTAITLASTGYGMLVLGAIFAIVLAIGGRSRWTTKAPYWIPMIAVRAAGTCAGDWLAFRDDPGLNNGLHLGLPFSTAFSCALFVATLFVWKTSATRKVLVTP